MILLEPSRDEIKNCPNGLWVTVLMSGVFCYNICGKNCMISLSFVSTCTHRGQWIAQLEVFNTEEFPSMEISFPRHYFDRDRAIQEVECWLRVWKQI